MDFLFLDGNVAWFDFVNTELVVDGTPTDLLGSFEDYVAWLRQANLIDDEARRAWGRPAGRGALDAVKAFRRILRETAERLWKGGSFPPAALNAINEALARSRGSHRLVALKKGFEVVFDAPPASPEGLLEPLARSVAEFLTRSDLGRVKRCGNPDCVLFFYDTTKNRQRRWCQMAVCGNRMKAAAHYRRLREGR
jgi:predicted RNA-binding Zn ribbon-like protein